MKQWGKLQETKKKNIKVTSDHCCFVVQWLLMENLKYALHFKKYTWHFAAKYMQLYFSIENILKCALRQLGEWLRRCLSVTFNNAQVG